MNPAHPVGQLTHILLTLQSTSNYQFSMNIYVVKLAKNLVCTHPEAGKEVLILKLAKRYLLKSWLRGSYPKAG